MEFLSGDMVIGVVVGLFAGIMTGLAIMRGEIKSANDTVDYFQSVFRRASNSYLVERDLNEGLIQELAAQAKLVK